MSDLELNNKPCWLIQREIGKSIESLMIREALKKKYFFNGRAIKALPPLPLELNVRRNFIFREKSSFLHNGRSFFLRLPYSYLFN